MKVAITGSHGLIGSALSTRLTGGGHTVVPVVRGAPAPGEISWDPAAGRLDPADLEGVDAVVHLAGVGIADKRWSALRKARILDSRTQGTELIAGTIAKLEYRPSVLLSASAIGYYGDRGPEELTEQSPPGTGFLAEVCIAWEAAAGALDGSDVRVVHLRTGIVMTPKGGALGKQLPLFKLGVGGRLGSGKQYTSWISLDDELGAIEYALVTPSLVGAVNLTAPAPVTNAEFTRVLGEVVHRPTLLPVPAFGLRLVMGSELADGRLLAGARVLPRALEQAGYGFTHPELEGALRDLLA